MEKNSVSLFLCLVSLFRGLVMTKINCVVLILQEKQKIGILFLFLLFSEIPSCEGHIIFFSKCYDSDTRQWIFDDLYFVVFRDCQL